LPNPTNPLAKLAKPKLSEIVKVERVIYDSAQEEEKAIALDEHCSSTLDHEYKHFFDEESAALADLMPCVVSLVRSMSVDYDRKAEEMWA
jgi:Fe-S oxidoreductase